MIHLKMKMVMGLTEVHRAGWLGFLTRDGLDGMNYSLQLALNCQSGQGVKFNKFAATCSAMPCCSLQSKYEVEQGKCSNKPPAIHGEALTMS